MALAETDRSHPYRTVDTDHAIQPALIPELIADIENDHFKPAFEPKVPIVKKDRPVHFDPRHPVSYEILTDRLVVDSNQPVARFDAPLMWLPTVFSKEGFRSGLARQFTLLSLAKADQAAAQTGMRVWTNIHPGLMEDPAFCRTLEEYDGLEHHGLEILERSPIVPTPKATNTLRTLHDRGVYIGIDDFPMPGARGNYAWQNTVTTQRMLGPNRQIQEIKIAPEAVYPVAHDEGAFTEHMVTLIGELERFEPGTITIEGVCHDGNIRLLQEDILGNFPGIDFNVQSRSFNPGGPNNRIRMHNLPVAK